MNDRVTERTRTEDAECRDAMRVLLRHPLVTADGPHGNQFATIRHHRDRLTRDFRQLLGYRLAVESGFARLYKAGLGPGGSRPLLRPTGAPFSPRAYTYLTLCCAVLLTSRQQILLSSLVEDVRHAGMEAGVQWGADSTSDRRAFVAALNQLVTWGVLVEDDGTVAAYADNSAAEALLFVRRDLVRHLLAIPLRDVETPGELVAISARPGSAGPRHHARRLLVEEPALLADDVDDDSWSWLRNFQRRESGIFEESFGLELEIRAEGVAAIDPRDELSDITFPRGGTLGHAALLALGELVGRLHPATTPRDVVLEGEPTPCDRELDAARGSTYPLRTIASVPIPDGLLDDIVGQLVVNHPSWWSKEYVDHPERLQLDVTDLLSSMRLVRRGADGLRLAAIASRYAAHVVDNQTTLANRLEDAP